MCVCAVPRRCRRSRARGFSALGPGPRAGGEARAARVGARGSVPRRAGVPGACLCVLDCKGKWLTAPSLPLLPFPSCLGPSRRMESPGAACNPRIRSAHGRVGAGARRPLTSGLAARRSAGSQSPPFLSRSADANAITEVE